MRGKCRRRAAPSARPAATAAINECDAPRCPNGWLYGTPKANATTSRSGTIDIADQNTERLQSGDSRASSLAANSPIAMWPMLAMSGKSSPPTVFRKPTSKQNHRKLYDIRMRHAVVLTLFFAGTAVAAPEKPKVTEEKPKAKPVAKAPDGFVEMFVAGVLTTEGGPAVILRDKSETKLLPIWIGFAEAHAIQLRLERRRFPRPLTHDLLETIMQDLGGSLVKIHVDDLKGDTYVGTVFVKHGAEIRHFDARPSDSIALALGNDVPIFVSESVLKRANEAGPEAPKEDEVQPSLGDPEGLKTL